VSRPTLGRYLAGILLALAVALGSVAPASASDATLKQAVKKLDRTFEKRFDAVKLPEDESSASYAKDFAAATKKIDRLVVDYRSGIAKERGSTADGREARKLLIKTADALRAYFKNLTRILTDIAAGDAPADGAEAKVKKELKKLQRVEKDNARAYKLLGLPAPDSNVPGDDSNAAV
jgi:hypothetical protein